jgi:hypothetical protein
MAWTAPQTWTAAQVVDESDLNTHLRDNLLETAPAKASTAGFIIRVTGANAIEEADPSDGSKLDGDTIDIDGTPSNYTPSAVSPAADGADLWAHLLGIDNALGAITSGNQHLFIAPHAVTGTAILASVGGNRYGVAALGDASNDGTAYCSLHLPSNFNAVVSALVWGIANGTGDLRYSINTEFGGSGEAYNANTDSIATTTQAVTHLDLETVDVSAALTGIAGSDVVGLAFTREGSDAADTISVFNVLGFSLEYTVN